MCADFTLDVTASCGFGLESGAFADDADSNEFRKMSAELLGLGKRSPMWIVRLVMILSFPSLAKALRMTFFPVDVMLFFEDLIKRTLKQRRSEGDDRVKRNDLIDLALEAINNQDAGLDGEEIEQFEKDAQVKLQSKRKIVDSEELELLLVANAIQLFMAGYETTSTIMAVCMYFLAKHPDVQERARQEVDDAYQGKDELDYSTLQGMSYLEAVLNESSRLWPLTVVERECVKDYKVSGTDFTIPKGMLVQLPTLAVMKDERHFGPDAEQFDPDRFFDPARRAERNPYSFLAFGQGPRNCLGMRFAMLQMKSALAAALKEFRFVTCDKTVDELVVDPQSSSNQPLGGFWVKVQKRN